MDLFFENASCENLGSALGLLDETRASLSQLFNNSPICMSMTTTDLGRRVYVKVNNKFIEIFGFTENEIIGKTSIEIGILDVEESARVGQLINEKGRLQNDYVKCFAKDGRIVHTVSSIERMTISGNDFLVAFFIDISQIKDQQSIIERQIGDLEAAFRELEIHRNEIEAHKNEIDAINNHLEEMVKYRTSQLEASNKRIRDYSFSNSHVVRAPLARILGLIQLAKLEPDLRDDLFPMIESSALELDSVIKEMTKILEDEGNRLDEIVRILE